MVDSAMETETDEKPASGATAVGRLIAAIGYPDGDPTTDGPFALRADGMEIVAIEDGGRIRLEYVLPVGESRFPELAGYAAGRMLKERATLAADEASGAAFLWQDAPAGSSSADLARLFETFADSCDWWRARAEEMRGDAASLFETEMIRP